MELTGLDIGFFVAFFAVVVAFSMYKSRKEETSEDYFLASRGLTWPLIGLSIVAANISTEQIVGMAGQGAGDVGLAVSAWQLTGSIGIILIAFTLLPRFLKAGIYTMPEYLEYRYNSAARSVMAFYTMIIYVVVLVSGVLYAGALTLHTIFEMNLTLAVWLIGAIAAVYTTWGGLKAVAYADLFQGAGLIIGGLITLGLGFWAVGGVDAFFQENSDKLHMFLPASHDQLPWTGVVAGMWIPIVYYCGLNQFIVQRTLAAKTLRQGQLGVIFAAALWVIVPFAIVFPGIMADQLYGPELAQAGSVADDAYPTLIRRLIPPGIRGVVFAALAGAIISSLASMLNSAATIFTSDLYKRHLKPDASESQLVLIGRIMTIIFVVSGCVLAPHLEDPSWGGVFEFIQANQGYISPGIVAAFLFGFVVKRAPAAAGVFGLVANPFVYGFLHWQFTGIHYLIRMAITFVILIAVMAALTVWKPLDEPRTMPERKDFDTSTSPLVKWAGGVVIAAVIAFFIIFR